MIDRYDMYNSGEPEKERENKPQERLLNQNDKPANITQLEYNKIKIELADCKKKLRMMSNEHERLKSYVNNLAKTVAEQGNGRFY